jgi:membrane fusion protein (multidrug efflux system)
MKMKPTLFGSMTLFVCVYVAACSVKSQSDPVKDDLKQELPVTQLITKDTSLQRTYVANIQAIQNVEIRNRITGFLEKIFVDEGQMVRKGQPLFQISDKEYKAEVAKAKANLSNAIAEAKAAQVEVSRVRILVEKKVVTPSDLEVALARQKALEAKVEEARSILTDANNRLSYTFIRAPFNGMINRIPLKKGSLLEEGTLLTTVSDASSVYTYFNISEDEYLHYTNARLKNHEKSSNTVQLILADGSTYNYTGKIETVASEFEENTGSIAFRARFPNPKNLLKHGGTGKIVLKTSVEDALMVPQKSVFEIQDKNYVYVVDAENKVKMKNFVPRTRIAHYYIVQSGLQPGDKIVYEGVQGIRDGMQIVPRKVAMDSLSRNAM